jgi:hypothetical protein
MNAPRYPELRDYARTIVHWSHHSNWSQDGGGRNLLKIPAPLPLIRTFRMSPLLARSISLDSTFNTGFPCTTDFTSFQYLSIALEGQQRASRSLAKRKFTSDFSLCDMPDHSIGL